MASEHPELAVAISEIAKWCDGHSTLSAIDPRRLAHELRIQPVTLTNALFFLVDKGVLRQVYGFETPNGYLIADQFDSVNEIPDELLDRYDNVVHRWDGEIVPVFRKAT